MAESVKHALTTYTPGAAVRSGSLSGETRRILGSVAVSSMGTWSYNVGIAVFAYQETHSTTWVAAATVGRYIPAMAITWFGVRLVEVWPRRLVAILGDVFCAVVMLALTFVAGIHGSVAIAIVLAAMSSGVSRVQSSATLSIAADVVAESQLSKVAGMLSSTEAVCTALGPALAAVVLLVSGPATLFLINGASFAVSAFLLAGIQLSEDSQKQSKIDSGESRTPLRPTLTIIWPLLAVRACSAVVYGVDVVLLAVIASDQLHQGTSGYGWLLAAAGLGGLLAAVWLHRVESHGRITVASTIGFALYVLPLLVFLLAPHLLASMATQIVRGAGCVLLSATLLAAIQRGVPSSISGQVMGLTQIVVMVGTSVGAVIAPVLLNSWGLDLAIIAATVLTFGTQLVLLPSLFRYDRGGVAALAALDPQVDLLRRVSLFDRASRSALYGVAGESTDLLVETGTAIVTQGAHADALYILVSGEVQVSISSDSGSRVVRHLTGLDHFGEIGLIHAVPRTATVTATTQCHLWRVPADTFLNAANQSGLSDGLSQTLQLRFAHVPDDS
ncbi:MAG: MFS transporter [Actinomycetes bacterium]